MSPRDDRYGLCCAQSHGLPIHINIYDVSIVWYITAIRRMISGGGDRGGGDSTNGWGRGGRGRGCRRGR